MGGYVGARAGSLLATTAAEVQDLTATDTTPEVTIVNSTHEDTDGGREGKVTFKGQQSGGEESTLAQIQASHDGTSDDEKGDLIFKTNDGSDGASPTEAMRIDSSQKVGIGGTPVEQLHINSTSGDARIGLNAPTGSDTEIKFFNNGSVDYTIGHDDGTDNFVIGTANVDTALVSVDKTGKVGIGVTDPSAMLEIKNSTASNASGQFRVNNNNDVGINVGVFGSSASTYGEFQANTAFISGSGVTDLLINTNTASSNIRFATGASGGTERLRITDNGLTFNGDTAAANALDDYEYGTFTPTFTGSSSNPSGVTYDPTVGNEGVYVKVGKSVFIQINIRTDAISNVGSGNLKISGLPFAAASLSGQGGYGSLAIGQVADFAGEAPFSCYVDEGASTIQLFYRSSVTGSSSASQCSDLATGTNDNLLRIGGTYYSTA